VPSTLDERQSGDSVSLESRDVSDNQLSATSTAAAEFRFVRCATP
jgi:hypothetical protein